MNLKEAREIFNKQKFFRPTETHFSQAKGFIEGWGQAIKAAAKEAEDDQRCSCGCHCQCQDRILKLLDEGNSDWKTNPAVWPTNEELKKKLEEGKV